MTQTYIQNENGGPYLFVQTPDKVRKIPLLVFSKVITGKLSLDKVEDIELMLMTIITEWVKSRPWYPEGYGESG